jgi:hypothetical protein
MTTVHTIRLGPPWIIEPIGENITRHSRKFGQPRTLDPEECLWLVTELPADAEFVLNGELLLNAKAGLVQFDITDRLQPRNALAITLQSAADVPLGEVRLEVRRNT